MIEVKAQDTDYVQDLDSMLASHANVRQMNDAIFEMSKINDIGVVEQKLMQSRFFCKNNLRC